MLSSTRVLRSNCRVDEVDVIVSLNHANVVATLMHELTVTVSALTCSVEARLQLLGSLTSESAGSLNLDACLTASEKLRERRIVGTASTSLGEQSSDGCSVKCVSH